MAWLLPFGCPGNSTLTTTNFISSEKVAHAWYFQDDWKATSKLTLNIGLRYELFSPIAEKFGRQSNYIPETATLVIPKGQQSGRSFARQLRHGVSHIKVERGIVDKYMIPWTRPISGLVSELRTRLVTKTVVRGGYGLFYGGEENQGGNPNRGEGVPFNQTMNLNLESNFTARTRFLDGSPTAGRSIRSTYPPISASVV